MFLRSAVFAVSMLSVSEAWLLHPHIRTSWTARQFGASGGQDDRSSDLSPEILGSPQWLENLSKTHRSGYYPASWSSTLKSESSPSLSQQYSNQYYNEPGSMLSRKSALSSPSPGRPSWSSPSKDLLSKSASSSPNSNFVHPDVSTSIRIQYCPIPTDASIPPSTSPTQTVTPPPNSQRKLPTHSTDTSGPLSPPDTVLLPPPTPTTTTMIPDDPLPYPEHKMMSFLNGGQHILHGNIAEFAEEKSLKNLQVVQAKKELFPPQESRGEDSSTTSSENNETNELTENVVGLETQEKSETARRDDQLNNKDGNTEKEEFIEGEMARWEEAARRDANWKAKRKNDTSVHGPDEEGIDLNGLQWSDDDTPPDAENGD